MKRLVVHIGLEKTGSTYVQGFLHENVGPLAAAGVAYPDFCQGSEHLEVYMAARSSISWMHRRKGIRTPEEAEALRSQVRRGLEAMAAQEGDVGVITCERLSYFRHEPELIGLRDLCSEHFDQVEVVAFLRRPDHAVGSYYGQAVKVGWESDSVTEFMSRPGRMLDHAHTMAAWVKVFGAENVFAWPYVERYRTAGDEALGVVLRHLGVEPPTASDPGPWRRPQPGTNARLSGEATEYIRRLNPLVPRWTSDGRWNGRQRNLLVKQVSARFPGPSAVADQALVDAVTNAFPAADIAASWRRPGDPDAGLWDEWLSQAPATGGPAPDLSDVDVQALKDELFVPRGTLIAGGPTTPARPSEPSVRRRLEHRYRSLRRRWGR